MTNNDEISTRLNSVSTQKDVKILKEKNPSRSNAVLSSLKKKTSGIQLLLLPGESSSVVPAGYL